jgi:hypothetical protein
MDTERKTRSGRRVGLTRKKMAVYFEIRTDADPYPGFDAMQEAAGMFISGSPDGGAWGP